LRIGFSQYAIAEGACGSSEITLSWSAVEPYLTPVGRDLAARSRS
jgi:hypothetical protein